mmetsp:Transcript_5023/g.6338  ORF Transcript_5023/g.6338 Transcript_5023/m.6338 type:complete len:130 (+) Transcript_5023:82-471(+)|eukprot:CAMPEP_0204883122 /NCGR_PEP_ID=MMETSP1349-20130617/3980_1 /ASSEMBLY_ACC=CAM_ASM_000710 /TAXON_ID=215587 /ORGANISM="Aplanochytrium stocchinoi, Strain GSBS06" /LENGTH=129 /DNA_ID=CAMNT_0052042709 /DNA_START=77 /DNA_END=466 /DNA_ORIENTATION=-
MSSSGEVTAALTQITGDQIKVFALVSGISETSFKSERFNKIKANSKKQNLVSTNEFQLDEDSDLDLENDDHDVYVYDKKCKASAQSRAIEDYYFAISKHGFWVLDRNLENFKAPKKSFNNNSKLSHTPR